jgi:hypothetical protein
MSGNGILEALNPVCTGPGRNMFQQENLGTAADRQQMVYTLAVLW